MTIKRLAVTGYKAHELGIFNDNHPGLPVIKEALKNRLTTCIEEGLEWVLVSGQLGIETWTVEVVWELQQTYPDLKYAIMTPFLDQEKNWNDQKKMHYQDMMARADFTTAITNRPYEAPWQFVEKNKFFVLHSDGYLIVYDEDQEGSPKYVKSLVETYIDKHDPTYTLMTIDAYDLQVVGEEIQERLWAEQDIGFSE
ncbi:DUF1273 domain-containing protein [Kurthia massiliensis]|uniref:DUF1273 domain-containing protein n=1 Tax=Kurthia massiliensis TaxID=1033739 RepID=UPI000288B245